MIKLTPLLLGLTLLLAPTLFAGAADSLYDPSSARPAGLELQHRFGPRSAGVGYDSRMIRAAQIAVRRAHAQTTWYCWRYVKNALVEAGLVSSRPATPYAKQAGAELCSRYGFRKMSLRNPLLAPIGAVIVYGGEDAGHVEIRTRTGFVSDFVSATPYPRPLVGIYIKPS